MKMMNFKYKMINSSMFDEDALIKMFEEEANNGWQLENVGLIFFKFTKSQPRKLKFFIDYNPAFEDYVEMISSLGYTFIDNYESLSFWYSEDVQKEELQNDPKAKVIAIKKILPSSRIILSIVIGLLCVMFYDPGGITTNSIRLDLGGLILHQSLLWYSLFALSLGITLLSSAASKIYTRLKYSRQAEGLEISLRVLKIIKFFYYVSRSITMVLFIPFFIEIIMSSKISLLILAALLGIQIFLNKRYSKKIFVLPKSKQVKINRSVAFVLSVIILAINITDPFQQHSPVPSQSVQWSKYNHATTSKYMFYTLTNYYGVNNEQAPDELYNESYIERLYECSNGLIANAIYEYQVEQIEHDSRIPSYQELITMTEQFDSNHDVQYKKFDDAILSMNKIASEKIDSGYGIANNFVMIKDNIVLCVLLNEDYTVDEIINAYF